jgi:hypothetical protein
MPSSVPDTPAKKPASANVKSTIKPELIPVISAAAQYQQAQIKRNNKAGFPSLPKGGNPALLF